MKLPTISGVTVGGITGSAKISHRCGTIKGGLYSCLLAMSIAGGSASALAQSHPARGLWVGQVTLGEVNQVSSPVDETGERRGELPNVTLPTADKAHTRLILHVSGSGQVRLLKEVALLNKSPDPNKLDLSLVTDEALFPDFPTQAARRIASASLDFGDDRAIRSLNALVDQAARIATEAALEGNPLVNLTPPAPNEGPDPTDGLFVERVGQSVLQGVGTAPGMVDPEFEGLNSLVESADINASFLAFLEDDFFPGTNTAPADFVALVGRIVELAGTAAHGDSGDAAARSQAAIQAIDGDSQIQAAIGVADSLATASAFLSEDGADTPGDQRGLMAIGSVKLAAAAAAGAAAFAGQDEEAVASAAEDAAHEAASRAADFAEKYNTFIGSSVFYSAFNSAVEVAAEAAFAGSDVALAIDSNVNVRSARDEALSIKSAAILSPAIEDTRAGDALEAVLAAVEVAAEAEAAQNDDADPLNDVGQAQILAAARTAGEEARRNFPADPVPASSPGGAFDDFVNSSLFSDAAAAAADAAAEEARHLLVDRGFDADDRADMESEIGVAVFGALTASYNRASLIMPNELLCSGAMESGGEVKVTVFLPANHPTNPFRHRRHSDHQRGRDITRNLTITLSDPKTGDPTDLQQAGYGVDSFTGTYVEEIFGLHKPLGQQPDTEPFGLLIKGSFELTRISLIDTLNSK